MTTQPAACDPETLAIALAPLVALKTAQAALSWALWGDEEGTKLPDVGLDLDWLNEP